MQLRNKLKKAKNINKIITNKREVKKAKKIEIKIKETKIKTKIIEKSIEANIKTNAKVVAITIIIIKNKKYLLRLRKQFACIYINFILKIILILLSYLLLFNNL